MDEHLQAIIVTVYRAKYGHNSTIKSFEITEGPNYVKLHIQESTIESLLSSLMSYGHSFKVNVETEEVTLIEYLSLMDNHMMRV